MPRRNLRLPDWQKQLWRGRLIDRLDREVKRNFLTVIQSPTGYGKSVLLANFAQWITCPVCWVQVTGAEREPREFLKLIATSINDTFTTVDTRSLWEVIYLENINTGIQAIREATAHLPPHLIIIEDLDRIDGVGINRVVDELLLNPWPSTRFIISVWYALSLTPVLENLSNERFGAIDRTALAFTYDEVKALLLKLGYAIGSAEIEQIVQMTEGSIAKILAVAPMWGQVVDAMDYNMTVSKLLAETDKDLVKFVRQTSVLPYLDENLCNRLLDITDSGNYLVRLHEQHLISTLSTNQDLIEYIDPIAITAQADLSMADRLCLYRKAIVLLLERQDYLSAGNMCFDIQDWLYLLEIIGQYGRTMYHQGHGKLLEKWLIEMPEWLFEQHVELMLLYGRLLVNDLSNPSYALELFSRAEIIFKKKEDMLGQARAWAWQSVALRAMGEPEHALRLANKSVTMLREWGETDLIAWSVRLLGLAQRAAGNLHEHFTHLQEALNLYKGLGDWWYIAQCHHDLGVGWAQQGNIEMAESHYQKAIVLWEKLGIPNYLANTISSVGVNRLLIGQPNEALVQFEKALTLAERSGDIRRQAYCLTGKGDAYLAMGQDRLALEIYEKSSNLATRADARLLGVYNKVKSAEALYQSGFIDQSLGVIEEALRVAEEKQFVYELGLALEIKGKIFMMQSDYLGARALFEQAAGWLQGCFPFGVVRNRLLAAYCALRDMRQQAALDHLTAAIQAAKSLSSLLPSWRDELTAEIEVMLAHFYTSPLSEDEIRQGIRFLLGRPPKQPQNHLYLSGKPFLIHLQQTRQFYDRGKIAKEVEMLAFLALNLPTRKEAVQEALWPDVNLEKSRHSFHWLLRHLRDNFYEEIVIQTDQWYRVNFQWVDIVAFETLLKRIEREGLETRLELIALYRGPFLDGFDLSDWGVAYRENMAMEFLRQVRLAARELLDLKQSERALNVILRGLREDAYQEDLYAMVREAYEQLKLDPTGYLTWAAEVIRSEVGVEPEFSGFS